MKFKLLLAGAVVCCLSALSVSADTPVSGSISNNTTWTLANSPYVLTGTVTIQANTRLTIEPGTEVQIYSGEQLITRGTLNAAGTSVSPISFTKSPGDVFGGTLSFYGSDYANMATGIIEHCSFSRLNGSRIIYSWYADLRIADSTFTNMTTTIMQPNNSRVDIVRNVMRNTREAINIRFCAGVIASNDISGIIGYADAIDLDGSWTGPGDPSALVKDNILSDGSDLNADGIDFGTASGTAIGNIIHGFGDKGISVGELSLPIIRNNLIYDCAIGIAVKDASDPVMENNTIVSCTYGIDSYRKSSAFGGKGTFGNSIIWNCGTPIRLRNDSTLNVHHSDIEGGWSGNNNIATDPLFIDAASTNYSLSALSPCINSGSNSTWMTTGTDIDHAPRIQSGTVDMGAYESGLARLDHFAWDTAPTRQAANSPFAVTITARDDTNGVLTTFTNAVQVSAWWYRPQISLLITECTYKSISSLEIQNVSTEAFSSTGWVAAIGDNPSDINSVNAITWSISSFSPGECHAKIDLARPAMNQSLWGGAINWQDGDPGWAMIVDDAGSVVDFLAWGWSAAEISAMSPTVNGHVISIGDEFSGDGFTATLGSTDSAQRIGNSDNNSATDFSSVSTSVGSQNAGLTTPFPSGPALTQLTVTPTNAGPFTAGAWSGNLSIAESATDAYLQLDYHAYTAQSELLDLLSLPLINVSLTSPVTEGDGTVASSVSITQIAASNIVVALSSDDTSEITVPATVTILTGQTNAFFVLTVQDDVILDGPQYALISASAIGHAAETVSITVQDNEAATLSVSLPASILETAGSATASVYVDNTPATNIQITLSSDNTPELTVPASVTMAAGQTSTTFSITAVDDSVIDGDQAASVTAHVDGWTNGVDTIQVLDNENTDLVVSLPSQISEGDGILVGAGSIQISGTYVSNVVISLTSLDTSEITVTSSVTIVAGQTTVQFDLMAENDIQKDSTQVVWLVASAAGFTSDSNTVIVSDDEIDHFSISPVSVTQTAGVPITVTIRAEDINSSVTPAFLDTVQLSASGDGGTVTISPTNTTLFTNGEWAGTITMLEVDSNVVITADRTPVSGTSTQFNVTGPSIIISPSVMTNTTVVINSTLDRTLTISNSGNAALSYSIRTPSTIAVASNLVLYYGFDSDTGATVVDESDNGWDGTLSNTTWNSTGISGGSMHIPMNGGIEAPLTFPVNLSTTSNWTFATWWNPDFLTNAPILFSKRNLFPDDVGINIGAFPGNLYRIHLQASRWIQFSAPQSAGSWHHAVFVKDGTTWTAYQDGQPLSQVSSMGWPYNADATRVDEPLRLGGEKAGGHTFSGKLDEIMLYNRALSSNEIYSIFISTSSISWISTAVTNGTLLPGESTNITVTLSSTGMSTGAYEEADITITCNDFLTPTSIVPVAMSVVDQLPITVTVPGSATEGDGILAGQGTVSVPMPVSSNLVISLLSDDTTEVTVPSSVTILSGSNSAVFDVTVANDPAVDGSQSAGITADAPDHQQGSSIITIHDNESGTTSVSIPASITEGAGLLVDQGLILIIPAPADSVQLTLSSSDTNLVTVPATVTVPGGLTFAPFDLTALDNMTIDGPKSVTITAHVENWTDAQGVTSFNDDEHTNLVLQLPVLVSEGDAVLVDAGSVSISGLVTNDVTISLHSDDTSEIQLPTSVVIIAGQTNIKFNVTVQDDALSDGMQTPRITASAAGFGPATNAIQVADDELDHFVFSAFPVVQTAGVPFSVTVTAADSGGSPIVSYAGSASLSATGDIGSVPVSPTSTTSFSSGLWAGSITVLAASDNVVLTADDGGKTGNSGTFDAIGAAIVISPSSLHSILLPDATVDQTLTISNAGNTALIYDITLPPASTATSNLLMHYSFDVDTGPVIQDDSGNGVTGTLAEAVWTSSGRTGGAYSFDGINDHIVVDRSSGVFDFDESTPFTVSAWAQPRNYVSGIYSMLNQFSTSGRFAWIHDTQAARLNKNFVANSAVVPYAPMPPDDTWSHVVMVYDGTTLHGYINGTLRGTDNWSQGDVAPADGGLWIGSDPDTSGRAFEGDIDEVMIFDRALTSNEVFEIFSATAFVEWLSIAQTNGTLLPGESTNITVTFYSTGMTTGTIENADITITCNDYTSPTSAVPASLSVAAELPFTVTVPISASEGDGTLTGQGLVSMQDAASSNVIVSLLSDDTSEATVPSTVTILAGNTSAVFDITVADDADIDGSQSANISADAPGYTQGVTAMTVHDSESATISVTIPGSVTEGAGLLAGQGLVLVIPAPTDAVRVALTSSDTNLVSLPSSVTVPGGLSFAPFDLTILDNTAVSTQYSVTVTAHVESWVDGQTSTTVIDDDPATLVFGAISSPQSVDVPFELTLTTRTIDGLPAASFAGTVTLVANDIGGSVSLIPTSTGNFIAGAWSGSAQVGSNGTTVMISADSGSGVTGTSDPFYVGGQARIVLSPTEMTNTPVLEGTTSDAFLNIRNDGNSTLSYSINATGNIPFPGGQLLHYSFDTNAGGFATDDSGNGLVGTVYGATWTPDGVDSSGYMSFDGSSDYIDVPLGADISSGNFTLAAWFKTSISDYRYVISFGNSGNNAPIVELHVNDGAQSGPFHGYARGDSGVAANLGTAASAAANDGAWHHGVLVREGSSFSLYLDGTLHQSATAVLGQTTIDRIVIGALGRVAIERFWQGGLDEVMVYDRALSSNDVFTMSSSTSTVDWLTVSPTSGTVLPNSSTNVTLTFDARSMSQGTSVSGRVTVTSNDSLSPSNTIPVSMSVTSMAQFWLSLLAVGEGSLDVMSGWFDSGTSIVVTASPSQYYSFDSWAGDTAGCVWAGNVMTVAVDQARSISALFPENLATNDVPEWWLAARGLTNLGSDAEALADQDGDGMPTWHEYIAGTSPTNPTEYLSIIDLRNESVSSNAYRLSWDTVFGHRYDLVTCTDMTATWTSVSDSAYSNVFGTGSRIIYSNTTDTANSRFFGVRVRNSE